MITKNTEGDLAFGKGPVISYAPAVQINHNRLLIETAQKNNIPFQRQASSRSTGTDTDAFAYSNAGVPSALISLPLRYMHTTVEMVHMEDLDNVIRLIYETLGNLKVNQDFRTFAK
jgi:putative aminopeptidase FrvX